MFPLAKNNRMPFMSVVDNLRPNPHSALLVVLLTAKADISKSLYLDPTILSKSTRPLIQPVDDSLPTTCVQSVLLFDPVEVPSVTLDPASTRTKAH
jgi:hypothetical protein